MITLMDRLEAYCQEHNKPVPYGKDVNAISLLVINEVKEAGKYDQVQKVDVTYEMTVNAYPDELITILDSVVTKYFKDRSSFNQASKSVVKKFPYDVQDYKSEAFEEALKKCFLPVEINKGLANKNGIVQYIIPVVGPSQLIKLGKTFQTERWLQENRIRELSRTGASKPTRKRVPIDQKPNETFKPL